MVSGGPTYDPISPILPTNEEEIGNDPEPGELLNDSLELFSVTKDPAKEMAQLLQPNLATSAQNRQPEDDIEMTVSLTEEVSEIALHVQETPAGPGLWKVERGLSRAGISYITIDVPGNVARAAQNWRSAHDVILEYVHRPNT